MKTTRLVILLTSFITPLLGCAMYQVRVNTYGVPGTPGISSQRTIAVINNPNAANALLEAQMVAKVETLLKGRGYSVLPVDSADLGLMSIYGIGDPTQRTAAFPLFQPGGTATATTTGPAGTSYSTIELPGHTSWVPVSVTQYTRYLNVLLVDLKHLRDTKEVKLVWAGTVISTGGSSDLRTVLNYMLIPLFERLGQDTGKEVVVVLHEGDKRVRALLQGTMGSPR